MFKSFHISVQAMLKGSMKDKFADGWLTRANR